MGWTILKLREKIIERIPKSIQNKEKPTKVLSRSNFKVKIHFNQLECDSAIGLHFFQNSDCAAHYHDQQFSILAKARIKFQLAALAAILIKTQKPTLCRLKEFVQPLQILHY